MKKIYIFREGEELGPFSLSEVFVKLTEGTLSPRDQARCEDDTGWRALEEVINEGTSFFSVAQIEQMREEAPLEPTSIPDLKPLRPTPIEENPKQRYGISVLAVFAVLLLLTEGVVAVRNRIANTSEDITDAASLAPSVPASSQMVMQVVPSPSPVANQQSSKGAYVAQPSPEATPRPIPSLPVAAQSPAVIEPTPAFPMTAITTASVAADDAQTEVASDHSIASVPYPSAVSSQNPRQPIVSTPQNASELRPLTKTSPSVVESQTPPPPQLSPTSQVRTVPSNATSPPIAVSNVPAQPMPVPFGQKVFASDFFKIESIQFLKKEPKSKVGVWRTAPPRGRTPPQFVPCLEVKVSARENTQSEHTFAKAYFFDDRNKPVASLYKPSLSGKPGSKGFGMPVLFYKDKPDSIFFEIPKEANDKNWKAIIVFGDRHEAHAACFPDGSDSFVDYPEKQLVHDPGKRIARKPAMDPLIQYEVKTKNPRQPKITLFLRPPKGISSAEEVNGVLCLCILAGSIDAIKRDLQKEEMEGDYNGLLGFANRHKLAVLAWGSTRLWNPGANFDDLPKEQAQAMDKSFDLVADAWARGVHELGEKYGIPQKDFLLWGACGSGQWAHRLCLRKPDYFLAIDVHMPGSYDKPTAEASKVLWCLTIGEREAGYERSLRFVAGCKKLGYPIIYKAIVGLGHAGHPDATAIGFKFFEFALTQKEARGEYDKKQASDSVWARTIRVRSEPWLDSFRSPPYYGDIVNQEMFSSDEVAMIPEGYRIPLPNKEIADIWARSH